MTLRRQCEQLERCSTILQAALAQDRAGLMLGFGADADPAGAAPALLATLVGMADPSTVRLTHEHSDAASSWLAAELRYASARQPQLLMQLTEAADTLRQQAALRDTRQRQAVQWLLERARQQRDHLRRLR